MEELGSLITVERKEQMVHSLRKEVHVVYLISPGCDPVMGDNRVKQ
jgi:hypothetical protein